MTGRGGAWRREVVRKAVHVGMVVLPLWLWFVPSPWRSRGLSLAFAGIVALDALRQVWTPWRLWVERRWGAYMRPPERRLVFSVHALTFSAWLLSWTTPPPVAVTALAYLIFGDAAAAVAGGRFGAGKGKSVAGSVACLATCLAIGWLLLPGRPVAIVAGALTATLVERLPWRVDDNLSVPLLSAAVLAWLLQT